MTDKSGTADSATALADRIGRTYHKGAGPNGYVIQDLSLDDLNLVCSTLRASLQPATPTADIRWAVNVLLEKIATKFEANETMDLWRSDAAATVRSFKHDLSVPATGGDAVAGDAKEMLESFLDEYWPDWRVVYATLRSDVAGDVQAARTREPSSTEGLAKRYTDACFEQSSDGASWLAVYNNMFSLIQHLRHDAQTAWKPDRDAIYRAIESNVRSEPDKHFTDRRWMVGINDAVDAILAIPSTDRGSQ